MTVAPSVDSAFPAIHVIEPFYNEKTWPLVVTPPWGEGPQFARKVLITADLAIRAFTIAGYQTQRVYFSSHTPTNGGDTEWLIIDMATRTATLRPEPAMSQPVGAKSTMRIELVDYVGPSGQSHAFPFNMPENATWEFQVGGGSWTVEVTSDETGFIDGNAAISQILSTAAMHLLMELYSAPFSTELGGLAWLLNPENWYPDNASPPPHDKFMGQLVPRAKDIWQGIEDNIESRREILFAMILGNASMATVLSNYSKTVKTIALYALLGIEQEEPIWNTPTQSSAPSPLDTAFSNVPYFEFLCMLAQRYRILPPLLSLIGLAGYWSPPEPETEPLTAQVTATTNGRVRAIRLFLFGQPAVDLAQAEIDRDPSLTPDLLDNMAWEYLGEQADGSHAIALNVGRGVSVSRVPSLQWQLHIDHFQSQRRTEIPRSIGRPANFVGEVVFYDSSIPVLDPTVAHAYIQTDDISATAPPRLDNDAKRAPRTIEPAMQQTTGTLSTISNFEWEAPPTLLINRLEGGAMQFDWFRKRPGTPLQNNTAPPDTPPDYSLKITPRDPYAGDFGVCYALDYGVLGHRPVDEDTFVQEGGWSVLAGLSSAFLPAIFFTLQHMQSSALSSIQPFGIGYFRLWYSGDVDIEVRRVMDSDQDFRVEIVRVADVMDLPEQGTRLPCRTAVFEDVIPLALPNLAFMALAYAISSWLEGQKTYDTMLEPGIEPIPEWNNYDDVPAHLWGTNGIDLDKAEHVAASEPFLMQMSGPAVPQAVTWSNVRRFIIDPRNTYIWPSGEPDEDMLLEGILDVDPIWQWTVMTVAFDVGVGMIPVYGDYIDAAEFYYVLTTGKDKWGQPVPWWAQVLMGITTLIPFVSNGWVKGARFTAATATGGVGIGTVATLMDGQAGEGGGGSLTARAAVAMAGEVSDFSKAVDMDVAMREGSTAYAALSRRQRAQILRDALGTPNPGAAAAALAPAARRLGKALIDSASDVAFRFEDALKPTGEFLSESWQDAYLAWRTATNSTDKTLWAFIQSRRYVAPGVERAGYWRVVAENFGLISYVPRVVRGTPQPGSLWPTLLGMVPGRWGVKDLDDVATALAEPNALTAANQAVTVNGQMITSLMYLNKYTPAVQVFLDACVRRSTAANDTTAGVRGLFSARSVLSHENDAVVYMCHIMELISDQHLQAREVLGVADNILDFSLDEFRTLGQAVEAGSATPAQIAKFDLMMDGMYDVIKKGMTKAEHYHGYCFEYRVGVYLTRLIAEGGTVIAVRAQALIDGKAGPDFVIFMVDGFAIVQCKAHQSARDLLGVGAHQANLAQIITDMVRLSERSGAVELTGDVATLENKFNGRYISSFDDDFLLANGDINPETLWKIGSGSMRIPVSELSGLRPEKLALINQAASNGGANTGDLIFDSLDSFKMAVPHIGTNATDALLAAARTRQASDMGQIVRDMRTVDELQIALTTGPNAERWAEALAAIMRSKKRSKDTQASDLMAAGGAQKVFTHFGIADNWQAFLTKQLNVSVLGQAELAALEAAEFAGRTGGSVP